MATDIGRLYAIIGADTSQFDKKMKGLGKRLSKVGKKLTTRLTLPLLALAGAAVKAGADFEYAMTNAWAVTGEGEEALVAMTAKAREMGAETIFSAKQAGDAMYYMASAGWDSKKMAEAIEPTLHLAAATQSDLAFATEAVISSMNQFQITTENTGRVTNVFAAAIMGSQATLEKLKISMTYIGPLANAMGHEIEGTTAALMGLYNAGYEASTAGTALRMALAKLTLGSGRTKEGLKALGLSLEDVNPEMHTTTEIIRKLEERSASAGDVIKIFSVRAGPAMATLINQGADALDEFEGNVTDTEAAAEMAEKQLRTFTGSFKLLTSIINEASIQIFQVLGPIIKDLIDKKIRPAIVAFTKFSDKKKKLIMIIAGVVAAIGPLLLIFGTLIGSIIPALITGVLALGKALLFLALNPVGLVITAVALLAFLVIKNWAKVKEVTTKVFGYIAAFFKAVWATIGDTVMTVLNFIVYYFKKAGGFLLKIGGIIGKGLVGAWKWCFSKAKDIFEAIGRVVIGALLKLANAIAKIPLVKKFAKNLKEALEATKKGFEESKEAMKKSREESDKLKKSTEELEKAELKKGKTVKIGKKELDKAIATEEAAIEAAKKWAEFEQQIGISTIEEKRKKIKELNEKLTTLEEKYKAGKYTATEYAEASKAIKDEIDGVNKSLDDAKEKTKAWASLQKELGISTIEEKRKKVEELGAGLKLLKGLYDEGKISLFDYTEGCKKLADGIDELNESLEDVTGKADAWISLQKELGISTIEEMKEKTAELEEKLKLLKEQYDAGVISLVAYTKGSKKLTEGIDELSEAAKRQGAILRDDLQKELKQTIEDYKLLTSSAEEGAKLTTGSQREMVIKIIELHIKLRKDLGEEWKELAKLLGITIGSAWKETFDKILGLAAYFTGELGAIFSQMSANEMTRIENEEAARRQAIENSLMSEEEKNVAFAKMDEEFDKKKAAAKRKEAKRTKAVGIFESIIHTASAVVEALPDLLLAIAVGIMGAAQTAFLAAQPLPLKEGAIFKKPTYLVGEEGTEILAPENKLKAIIEEIVKKISIPQIIIPQMAPVPATLAMAPVSRFEQPPMARERGGGGFREEGDSWVRDRRILHLHQTIKIGEDKIKHKITKIVMEEAEKGNVKFPAKVIK